MVLSETSLDPRVEAVWRKVSSLLKSEGIRFAPIGGFALNQQGVGRPTMDIDVVVSRKDWERAAKVLRPIALNSERLGIKGEQSDAALRFEEGPWVEIFPEGVSVEEVTRLAPDSIFRPNPAGKLKFAVSDSLEHLITLKLASALCSGRLQDASDVQKLIAKHGLKKEFSEKLPSQVRRLFIKLTLKPDTESMVDFLSC